jgi:hypothetical protein
VFPHTPSKRWRSAAVGLVVAAVGPTVAAIGPAVVVVVTPIVDARAAR